MTVLELDDDRGLALCEDSAGERQAVEVTLVESIEPGDEVLVHAGVALVRLEPGAAEALP
jgi:hydrogenase maturation factor